jgi:hypothetical protein
VTGWELTPHLHDDNAVDSRVKDSFADRGGSAACFVQQLASSSLPLQQRHRPPLVSISQHLHVVQTDLAWQQEAFRASRAHVPCAATNAIG